MTFKERLTESLDNYGGMLSYELFEEIVRLEKLARDLAVMSMLHRRYSDEFEYKQAVDAILDMTILRE